MLAAARKDGFELRDLAGGASPHYLPLITVPHFSLQRAMSEVCMDMDINIYLHVPGIYRPFSTYLSFLQTRVGRTRFLRLGGEVEVVIDLGLRYLLFEKVGCLTLES